MSKEFVRAVWERIEQFLRLITEVVYLVLFWRLLSVLLVIFFAAVWLPEQTREFYLNYLASDDDILLPTSADTKQRWHRFALGLGALIAFSVFLASYAVEVWYRYCKVNPQAPIAKVRLPTGIRFMLAALPTIAVATAAFASLWKAEAGIALKVALEAILRPTVYLGWWWVVLLPVMLILWAASREAWTRLPVRRRRQCQWSAGIALAFATLGVAGTVWFFRDWLFLVELKQFLLVSTRWLWVGLFVMSGVILGLVACQRRLLFLREYYPHIDVALTCLSVLLFPVLGVIYFGKLNSLASSPSRLSDEYDGIFLLLMFLSCTTAIVGMLMIVGDRFRVPIVALLVTLVASLSVMNWNNHYRLQLQSVEGVQQDGPLPAQAAFQQWLWSRSSIKKYVDADRPFPVLLVAAQGGGSYAAYHAALTLAKLQDKSRLFSEHTFAISGVSGGSVGASIFLAALHLFEGLDNQQKANLASKSCSSWRGRRRKADTQTGPLERLIQCYFQHDLMSPSLTTGLFNDIPSYFLPTSWRDRNSPNRARTFQNTIDSVWHVETDGFGGEKRNEYFNRLTSYGWRPDERVPAFLVNATIVETGSTVFFGPLRWGDTSCKDGPKSGIDHSRQVFGASDIRILEAVVLSARFPWVFPAATMGAVSEAFGRCVGVEGDVRIVDGGYTENSGAATAGSLLEHLRQLEVSGVASPIDPNSKAKVKFHLVTFSHVGADLLNSQLLSEGLVPIFAMLNARVARGLQSIHRVATESGEEQVLTFNLGDREWTPPLGLMLSDKTLKRIEARSGFAKVPEQLNQDRIVIVQNNAVAERIVCLLEHGHSAGASSCRH